MSPLGVNSSNPADINDAEFDVREYELDVNSDVDDGCADVDPHIATMPKSQKIAKIQNGERDADVSDEEDFDHTDDQVSDENVPNTKS